MLVLLVCTLLLLLLARIYLYIQIKYDVPVPYKFKQPIHETPNWIQIKANQPSKYILVYFHGGSFISGWANASRSIMTMYSNILEMDVFLVKYPLRESAKGTIKFISSTLLQLNRPMIFLGSSAGGFWALAIMCCIYSQQFRQYFDLNQLPLNVKAFVGMCGYYDTNHHNQIINYLLGPVPNPIDFIDTIPIPLCLIDAQDNKLSFTKHVTKINQLRQLKLLPTNCYVFTKERHNFLYYWKNNNAQIANILILKFIAQQLQFTIKWPDNFSDKLHSRTRPLIEA